MCEWVNDWMSEGLMQWQYYGINRWQTFRPQSGQSNVFFRRHRRRRRHRHYLLLLLPIHFIPLFHQLNFQPSNCRLISYELERNVMLHWRFWVPLFFIAKVQSIINLKGDACTLVNFSLALHSFRLIFEQVKNRNDRIRLVWMMMMMMMSLCYWRGLFLVFLLLSFFFFSFVWCSLSVWSNKWTSLSIIRLWWRAG